MELHVDGRRVFAATGGPVLDSNQPAVVFVHGAGFDRTTWVMQTRYFAHHGFGVLAVDLPGHGRSEGEPLATIDAVGDWLVRLIDVVGLTQVALVGHSMGALAVLSTAARYPSSVSRLALLGVSETMSVHPDLLAAAQAGDHLAVELVAGWSLGAAAHRGGHASPGNWMLGAGVRILERAAPGVLHIDLMACAAYQTAAEMAKKVTCPTLLLLGEADRMTPVRAADALIGRLSDVTVEVLPGVGHLMMLEKPRLTTAALERFLTA